MTGESVSEPTSRRNALLAIAVGGGVAGVVDILQAFHRGGLGHSKGGGRWHAGAAGFPPEASAPGFWVFFLHFFIAFSAAAVYYAASRRPPFLTEYPLVCGLCFGAGLIW